MKSFSEPLEYSMSSFLIEISVVTVVLISRCPTNRTLGECSPYQA